MIDIGGFSVDSALRHGELHFHTNLLRLPHSGTRVGKIQARSLGTDGGIHSPGAHQNPNSGSLGVTLISDND